MISRQVYRLQAGNFDRLRISEENLPAPESHEVQVRVLAIGLNFADIFAIWGLYSATPKEAFIPGLEFSGEVVGVGSMVDHVQVGQMVMGVTRFGAYATYLNLDQRYLLPLPDQWTSQEGAAYLVQALTAFYGLMSLADLAAIAREIRPTVLIHSGAGGVGVYANRMAKLHGAYTIGTIGSRHKEAFMLTEGYDQVIVRDRSFGAQLAHALGDRSLDIIMECIGGDVLKAGWEQLAAEGRMIVYGAAQYASGGKRPNYPRLLWKYLRRPRIDPQRLTESNRSVMGFNLIWLYEKADKMRRLLSEMESLDLGRPMIGETFDFRDLPNALQLFKSGATMGKVVVTT